MSQHELINIETEQQYNEFVRGNVVVHFWAEWCTPTCPKMDKFCLQLWNRVGQSVQFGRLEADAEHLSKITEDNNITAVPSFLLYHSGRVVGKVEGADPMKLAKAVEELKKLLVDSKTSSSSTTATTAHEDLNTRIKKTIHAAENMLFMKGTPAAPQCGFSRQMVDLLQRHSVKFGHFDILTDEAIRQGLKDYSNWPTYPQLYHNGELIGGLDIVKDLEAEGQLDEALELDKQRGALRDRLRGLINMAPIMLFMKGTPSAPKCGFSRQVVQLLQKKDAQFGHFDILTDESVRQGLKDYSNWQTYPQLYVKGELIGGLDIVNELEAEGQLDEALELE